MLEHGPGRSRSPVAGVVLWRSASPSRPSATGSSPGSAPTRRTAGQVMDRGLWRYTRHPNYFGDACVWWGLFVSATASLAASCRLVSPLLMTFILTRGTGQRLTERRMPGNRPATPSTSADQRLHPAAAARPAQRPKRRAAAGVRRGTAPGTTARRARAARRRWRSGRGSRRGRSAGRRRAGRTRSWQPGAPPRRPSSRPIRPNAWWSAFALRPRLALVVIAAWNTSLYASSVTSLGTLPAAATIRPAAR